MRSKLTKLIGLLLIVIFCVSMMACNQGKSAYDIAVDNGFVGTEQEWLDSLKGKDGKSAYEIACDSGLFSGTEEEWLKALNGKDGLDGVNGKDGKDIFEVWYEAVKEEGYKGSYSDFLLEYIKGTVIETQDGTVNVANNALLSSVEVYAKSHKKGAAQFFSGGGTIIQDDKESGTAYIVTNYHVIYDPESEDTLADDCYIMFYGMSFLKGEENSTLEDMLKENAIKVEVIGGSFTNDIAVLKLENSDFYKNSPYKVAKIANSDDIIVGDTAITVGNPSSEGLSITKGIISVDSEYLEIAGADDYTQVELRLIRTDSDINHGNSGGGLFNSKGEFAGVVSVRDFSTNIDGFGYAIPSNVAIGISNNIIKRYEDKDTVYEDELAKEGFGFNKCTLGVEVYVAESFADYDEIEGVVRIKNRIVVATVHEGAAQSFIQPGDEMVKATLNGVTRDINRLFTVSDLLVNAEKDDIFILEIIRKVDGERVAMTLEIPLINTTYVM
ncbi:MAG: trypsin-like serine protease [Clostridiales bacterium]|nr:trypsin-like serine protease [Clostridiales bacterium]